MNLPVYAADSRLSRGCQRGADRAARFRLAGGMCGSRWRNRRSGQPRGKPLAASKGGRQRPGGKAREVADSIDVRRGF